MGLEFKGLILLIIALLSLASSPIFIRLAQSDLEFIGFWRLLGTFFLLLLWGASKLWIAHLSRVKEPATRAESFRKRIKHGSHVNFLSGLSFHKSLKTNFQLSFWGGLFFFLHLWTYIYAAQHTRVANLVLIFSLNPIFTATLSKILIKQAFPKGFWLSYGLSFLGLGLLFKDHLLELMGKFSFILDGGAAGAAVEAVLRPSAERNVFVLGDLIALMSGGLHSLYLISASQARERLSNLEFSLMFYFIGAMGFLIVGLAQGVEFFSFNPTVFMCLMGLIIFPTLLGHFVITYLIKAGNMTQLALAKLIEPPFSVILAFLFLGEEFRLSALLAFACIALALFNLYRRGQPTQSYLRR